MVVAAAGNSAGHAVELPANCPGVIAVAGLRHVGSKVGFSDLGSAIAISAPAGNCINIGVNEPCLYPILSSSNSGTQRAQRRRLDLDRLLPTTASAPASPRPSSPALRR